jgi:hypothetical protein
MTFTLDAALPGLVQPGTTTGTDTRRPTFSWTLDADTDFATWMQLIIDGDNATQPVSQWLKRVDLCDSATSTACDFTPGVDLTDDVTYTMRIRTYGPGGLSDQGFAEFSPVTITLPKPGLLGPVGEITNGFGNPIYAWEGVPGSDTYELYVGKGGTQIFYDEISCGDPVCTVELTSRDEAYRLTNGVHEFYVRALYADDTWSPWAGPMPFTLNAEPPAPVTPEATTGTTTRRPTFNWALNGTAANATWMQMVLTDGGGATAVSQWLRRETLCGSIVGTDCDFTPDFDLTDGETYTLNVLSYGPGGIAPAPQPFDPVTIMLPKPALLAPLGTIDSSSGDVTFNVSIISGATEYEIYVGPFGGGPAVLYEGFLASDFCTAMNCSVSSTQLSASALLDNGDYIWYARARYANGNWSPWTTGLQFSVDVPPPAAPSDAGVTGTTTLQPTINWTVDANTSYTRVQVFDSTNSLVFSQWFTREQVCGSYSATSCAFQTPPLTNGVTYSVILTAYGPGGLSGLSTTVGPFAIVVIP